MLALRQILVLAFLFVSGVQAVTVAGRLLVNTTLENDAFAQLTSIKFRAVAPIWSNATFRFWNVDAGDYVLAIRSRKSDFQTYFIQVLPDASIKASLYAIGIGALPGTSLPYPLVIPSVGEPNYFDPTPSFSLIALAKGNPTILMMLVAAISMLGMPKLLAMLDPETVAEVQQNQADMHSKIASFQNMDLASAASKFLIKPDEAPPVQDKPRKESRKRK